MSVSRKSILLDKDYILLKSVLSIISYNTFRFGNILTFDYWLNFHNFLEEHVRHSS